MTDEEYRIIREKILKRELLCSLVYIIGVVMINRPNTSPIFSLIGIVLFIGACILDVYTARNFRKKDFRERYDEETGLNDFSDITKNFGMRIVLIASIFSLIIMLGGLFLVYWWTRSWVKFFLVILAFNFVYELKEYNDFKNNS